MEDRGGFLNIGICGLGKAGKQLVEYTLNKENYNLCSALCRQSSSSRNLTVTEITNIKTKNEIVVKAIEDFDNSEELDVIIDFSGKSTTMQLVDLCCKYGINLVICPTNFTDDDMENIANKALINKIGIIYAPTLTVGVNAMITFVKVFSSLFPDFSFEIIEKHGKFKPYPTKTANIIANSIDRENVHISSVRLDGYVGIHEVIATNGNERISFCHESFSRNAFANGALLAADFINNKVGFFDIKEMYAELMRK